MEEISEIKTTNIIHIPRKYSAYIPDPDRPERMMFMNKEEAIQTWIGHSTPYVEFCINTDDLQNEYYKKLTVDINNAIGIVRRVTDTECIIAINDDFLEKYHYTPEQLSTDFEIRFNGLGYFDNTKTYKYYYMAVIHCILAPKTTR